MRRTLSKKQLSLHKENVLDEQLSSIQNVQLTADNILDKLLHPTAIDKKQPENMNYKPKFEKRDYETIVHQNLNLKQQLNEEKETVSQLRFKLGEMQRKIKFLQGIQEKWENSVQEGFDSKKLQVYTQILKKKIQELNELYLNSQQKIKELRRLPHVSVFEEQSVQMEQMKRQTIRLKAIIASMVDQQRQQDNLENKFVKLMREENQKLKSTIRLLENDKNLLKSRQTIQKRQITDYKKEIDDLKRKLVIREAQIQKVQNQTKNILLKKAHQIKSQQEKRDNQEIQTLKATIQRQRLQIQRINCQKEQLWNEKQKLQKKQKQIETNKSSEDKQKNELRNENNRLRRAIEELKNDLDRQKENIKLLEQHHKKKKIQIKPIITEKVQQLVPVKFQELELPLLHIIYALQSSRLSSISALFQAEDLSCGKVVDVLCDDPIGLQKSQAVKLVRYLTEDSPSQKVQFNQKKKMDSIISCTILKASINKILQCRNAQNEDLWRCLLAKARKLIPQLQKHKLQIISKQQFQSLLSLHLNQSFGSWVQLIILQCFQPTHSQLQIMLNVNKIVQILNKILVNQPLH